MFHHAVFKNFTTLIISRSFSTCLKIAIIRCICQWQTYVIWYIYISYSSYTYHITFFPLRWFNGLLPNIQKNQLYGGWYLQGLLWCKPLKATNLRINIWIIYLTLFYMCFSYFLTLWIYLQYIYFAVYWIQHNKIVPRGDKKPVSNLFSSLTIILLQSNSIWHSIKYIYFENISLFN